MHALRQTIWQMIQDSWGPPLKPLADPLALESGRQAGQAANAASVVHDLDLFCRKELSRTMQQLRADQVRCFDLCPSSQRNVAEGHLTETSQGLIKNANRWLCLVWCISVLGHTTTPLCLRWQVI